MAASAHFLFTNMKPFLVQVGGSSLAVQLSKYWKEFVLALMKRVEELLKSLHVAVSFILQGLSQGTDSLVSEWTKKGIESLNNIVVLIGEAVTFMETIQMPYQALEEKSSDKAVKKTLVGKFTSGITGAYSGVYQLFSSSLGETVERLSSMAVSRTFPCSLLLTPLRLGMRSEEAEMLKSCYDCITLTEGILKKASPLPENEEDCPDDWISVGEIEDLWREKTLALGSIAQALVLLSAEAERAASDTNHDTRILRMYVGELELLITNFSQTFLCSSSDDADLNDIRHAVNSVRKLAGERTLRNSVRRGRNVEDYSPIPARFFASPGMRKLKAVECAAESPVPVKSIIREPNGPSKELNVQFDVSKVESEEGNVALKRLRFEDD